jgi:hypothetical protein
VFLAEADVFDDEDDLEDLEPEEFVEEDEAVLDLDEAGVVAVLESEVPAKMLDDRMSEGYVHQTFSDYRQHM